MQISWVPLPQGVLQGSNPGISQSCGLISRLDWGRIPFQAQDSVPRRLLARGLPQQFVALWAFP